MIVYYITFSIFIFLCFLAQNQDYEGILEPAPKVVQHTGSTRLFYILAACTIIFVAGFRYFVGADFATYYRHNADYIRDLPNSIRELDEPGYGMIAWVATRFANTGAAAIFGASLLTIALPMIVIYRNTSSLLMAGFLYITTCWISSFNGVRQFLACSVLFCGYEALKNQKPLRYLFWCLLAFLFHRSAIVMVLLYPAVHRKVNALNVLITIIATAVLLASYDRLFSFANFIMESEYAFDNPYTATQVNRIRVIVACIPAIIFLIEYHGKELTESETLFLNIQIIHAAICVLTMNSALLYRIGLYLSLFKVLATTELLKGIEEPNRRIITAGIVIMMIGMWWYEIYISGSLNNFRWIWSK